MTYDPRKGVQKVANTAAIKASTNPQADDLVIAQDTGITYQYRNGSWTAAMNMFTDPSAFGNWVLVDSKSFTGQVPSGSFDISGCSKFKIELDSSATPSGPIVIQLGGDTTASHYKTQAMYAGGATISANLATTVAGLRIADNWGNIISSSFEFNKISKLGHGILAGPGAGLNEIYFDFIGVTSDINTLSIVAGTSTLTGTINVYKWQSIKPVELASYELVATLNPVNQAINDGTSGTIDGRILNIDGDADEDWLILSNIVVNTVNSGAGMTVRLNGDITAANYQCYYSQIGTSALAAGSQAGMVGFQLAFTGAINYQNTSYFRMNTHSRSTYRKYDNSQIYGYASQVNAGVNNQGSYFAGTSKITSFNINTTSLLTGTIRIFKMTKTAMISTNPNLLTVSTKYIDANTVQVQPGEVEINGAICQVTQPISVTLSGNLEAGLTEAANTYYYMYAVRGTGRSCSFMFSTTAPLMDRYGNTIASFDLVDQRKAAFHPTKGLNYRFIGQVYNDASSNILTFDKMYPGYWEGSWTAIPGTNDQLLKHGSGKIPIPSFVKLLVNSSASSTGAKTAAPYFTSGGNGYGVMFDNSLTVTTTNIALAIYFGLAGIFQSSSWQTTGYYKLIIKE